MVRNFAVLILALLLCYVSGVTLAQVEEETEYTWGIVSSVSSDQIVISEYDYDTEKEIEVTYAITSDTELKNVDSLKDIAIGGNVDIEYVVREEKRVAKIISVERLSNEEEYMPSETYEEQPEYSPEEIHR